MGNKWNNRSYAYSGLYVSNPGPLVWLVVESNHFCYFILVNPTVSEQCRLYLWGKSEWFYASTISILYCTILCTMGPSLFPGLYIPMFFFWPFIMFIEWMVHVHTIKFNIHLMLWAPTPILSISINIVLWFLDALVFKVGKYLNIPIVGVP